MFGDIYSCIYLLYNRQIILNKKDFNKNNLKKYYHYYNNNVISRKYVLLCKLYQRKNG